MEVEKSHDAASSLERRVDEFAFSQFEGSAVEVANSAAVIKICYVPARRTAVKQ